jgi:HemY protein
MRLLFTALLAMAVAVGLALLIQEDSGYVLIGYKVWTLETSLAWFLLLGALLFGLLYFGLRLMANILATPQRIRSWKNRRGTRRARRALNQGLVELSEGQWKGAEKHLLRYADQSESPLLNYLAAARSAQQQGAHERRDHYLQLAHESMPSADVAVGLTQAELQLAHEQLEQALATLMHLRSIAPRHAHVLNLLKTLYKRLEDWQQLRDLIPELRKQKAIDEAEQLQLEVIVYTGLLNQAARDTDNVKLGQVWNQVPRNLRGNEALIATYAQHLMTRDQNSQAETLIRETLRHQWNEELIELYGRIKTPEPNKQLSTAEEWLKKNPRNPVLLLALGRLSQRCKLWGKARSYLEAAIGVEGTPATYRELGALLEQMGEADKALACYRSGLKLYTECPQPVMPAQEGELIKAGEEDSRLERAAADANAPKKAASV